ncbi:hypothetical protein TWF481_008594 [Arthrobotrys musiformis]|uniref:Uncharacterized protein n=1 Tax=Arthrobotrys musiformis TaxID=47236 RepID=A0AAV9W8J2_9PEZI
MKYQTLGFCIASLAVVANCQSLDPAWGVGHYGGDIGLWYPRSSTTTISAPVPTSSTVRATKNEKAATTSTGGGIESTPTTSEIESTSTTTKFVTRTTTITIPVTMSPPPAV